VDWQRTQADGGSLGGRPRRSIQAWLPRAPASDSDFDSNGVATAVDAQRRSGRRWNPARRQPLALYTFLDAGGRRWSPAETNS